MNIYVLKARDDDDYEADDKIVATFSKKEDAEKIIKDIKICREAYEKFVREELVPYVEKLNKENPIPPPLPKPVGEELENENWYVDYIKRSEERSNIRTSAFFELEEKINNYLNTFKPPVELPFFIERDWITTTYVAYRQENVVSRAYSETKFFIEEFVLR